MNHFRRARAGAPPPDAPIREAGQILFTQCLACPMSQDVAPYHTELSPLSQQQTQTLAFVPFIRFRHTLEALALRFAQEPPPASSTLTQGHFTFESDRYVATYVVDHAGRKILVTDVSLSGT
jgi:hypothetical protein